MYFAFCILRFPFLEIWAPGGSVDLREGLVLRRWCWPCAPAPDVQMLALMLIKSTTTSPWSTWWPGLSAANLYFLPSHTRKAIYVLPLSHTTMCLIYCNFYLDEIKAMISQGKFVSYSFSSQVYLHSTKPNSYNCIMHISWIHLPTFCVHQSNVVGFQIWHRIWFCQLFISIFSSM